MVKVKPVGQDGQNGPVGQDGQNGPVARMVRMVRLGRMVILKTYTYTLTIKIFGCPSLYNGHVTTSPNF